MFLSRSCLWAWMIVSGLGAQPRAASCDSIGDCSGPGKFCEWLGPNTVVAVGKDLPHTPSAAEDECARMSHQFEVVEALWGKLDGPVVRVGTYQERRFEGLQLLVLTLGRSGGYFSGNCGRSTILPSTSAEALEFRRNLAKRTPATLNLWLMATGGRNIVPGASVELLGSGRRFEGRTLLVGCAAGRVRVVDAALGVRRPSGTDYSGAGRLWPCFTRIDGEFAH